MDEQELDLLLDLVQSGTNEAGINDANSLREIIENEGIEVFYDLMPEGSVTSPQELAELFPSLKKKDSNQPSQNENVSSSSLPSVSSSGIKEPSLDLDFSAEDIDLEKPTGERYGNYQNRGEENTWLERNLGKNFITDYFGDLYRAGAQGIAQGSTLDEALQLFVDGANASEEDVKEYLDVVGKMDQYGMSDEMAQYNKIYEDAGRGPWGVIKGLFLTRGQIIPQVLVSSLSSMLNPTVAAGAGVGAATGAVAAGTVGAAAGSIGGPVGTAVAGALSASGGAVGGMFAGASAVLETGLSFTEFLKEEVEKLGLEFDEEGVLETLSSPGVIQSIRNRAAGRGFTIGIIDGITRGVASQLVLKPAKALAKTAKAAGKQVSRLQKANNALKAAGIEAVGGSSGEVAARLVADQELDASEIALEGLVGNTSALLSVPQAITGKTVIESVAGEKAQAQVDEVTEKVGAVKTKVFNNIKDASGKVYDFTLGNKGLNVFRIPVYGIKNKAGDVTSMSKDEILEMITTMSPEDIRTAQFEVKNDPVMQEFITTEKEAAQLNLNLPDYIKGENRTETIKLEMELRNIKDPTLEANKVREKEIKTRLKEIVEVAKLEAAKPKKTKVVKTPTQSPAEVRKLALDQLEADGVTDPTEKQINDTVNAIQKSSTTEVDAQESTEDSTEVGEGDPDGSPAVESGTETTDKTLDPEAQAQEEVVLKELKEQAADLGIDADADADSTDNTAQSLGKLRQKLIDGGKEKTNIFKKVTEQINKSAKKLGISPNEYVKGIDPEVANAERVERIAQDIKKKIESRRPKKMNPAARQKQVITAVVEYLKQTKLAEQLNDVQFDALVRKISKDLGAKAPTQASVNKAFKLAAKSNPKLVAINERSGIKGPSKPKAPKKVVVNERVALKEQIILQYKAAKGAVKAYKTFLKNITAQVKSLKKAGKISTAQVTALTEGLSRVTPFSQKSVDSYLKKVETIFNKADYANTVVKAKRLVKRAKTNLKSKIGVIKGDLKTTLQDVFSLSPYIIPESQLSNYMSLLEQFTKLEPGTGELSLQESGVLRQKALEILNAIEADNEVNDNLSIDDEVTPDDYNVDENVDEVKSIKITNEQINNIEGKDGKRIARFLRSLTVDQIKGLARKKKDGTMDYSGIETLKAVLKNIQSGYVTQGAMKIKRKVVANDGINTVGKVITEKSTKANILRNIRNSVKSIKAYFRSTSTTLERMRGGPLFNIDDIIGNFNSKLTYRNTFGRLQKAYETFRASTNIEYAKIDAAEKALENDGVNKPRKWFSMGRSRNSVVEAKTKIRLFQLQREYLSNFIDGKPNLKAPSAIDFVNATLKVLKAATRTNQNQVDIITKIANKFTVDSQIDLEKLEKSFTKAEKQYLKTMDEVNNSQAEKALFISSMHGSQVDLFNNYSHHASIGERSKQLGVLQDLATKYNESINGKTKSGTIETRKQGASAISFDPSYSAKRGLQATNMDYYMTETLKEVSAIVEGLVTKFADDTNSTTTQVQVTKALAAALKEVNQNVFINSFNDVGPIGELIKKAKRLGYQAALASIARGGAELIGNVNMLIRNPKRAIKGIKNFTGMTIFDGATVYNAAVNLGSGVVSKLADSDVLKGKYTNSVDMGAPTRRSGEAVSRLENVLGMIKRFSGLPQIAGAVNKLSNKILSFPDQVLSRPLWFQTYSDAFAKATGISLTSKDFKKIAEGDSKYLGPEFQEARKAAVDAADNAIVVLSTSNNPYDGVLKIMPSAEDGASASVLKEVNGFLARYSLFEYGNATHALMALFNKGEMSKMEAAAMLTGTTMRMASYMVAYTFLTNVLDEELFDAVDERKEDDDLEDLMARQMIGSIATLLFGGNIGNLGRIPINFALEYGINEPLMESLRNGKDYDPYIHSMVFSQLNMQDIQKGDIVEAGIKIGAGAFGPALNTLRRLGLVLSKSQMSQKPETRKKYQDELEERMLVEVLGNTGMLPFYKDIRRIILKQMFGAKKLTAEEKRAEAEFIKNNKELFKDLDLDIDTDLDLDLDIDTDFDIDL